MLSATRRRPPLLEVADRDAFRALVTLCFRRSSTPIRRILPGRVVTAVARSAGFSPDACAVEIGVDAWVDLFRAVGMPGERTSPIAPSSEGAPFDAAPPSA
jgi:hypothetical protein